MQKQWQKLKEIISNYEPQKQIFTSIINEKGKILSANAKMQKELHLNYRQNEKSNFFELINPFHLKEFLSALNDSVEGRASSAELYLKNGYYHPMKWQINLLADHGQEKNFLCIGHKLIDDERQKQFNKLGGENYQLIFGGLNAGVFFQDTKGELIAANQKAAIIFNTTLERLYQLTDIENLWNTIWEIRSENGEKVLFKDTPFMKAIKTGQPQTEVLNIRLNNGEQRWLHFSSQPLFEKDSTIPSSVVSNMADLTHEKKLISELMERKALFKSFMNQTPNMAWVVDEDACLVFANQAFFQYFGLTEKDSLNKKITDIVPGQVANALYDKHIEVMETGKPVELVEKVQWADGTDLVFHINIFTVEGLTDKRRIGGHAVNLTDKYTIEKKLKEANDRLLLLTRTTTDAIWEWDMQAGSIFRNDALMDIIGYQQDNSKGLSWWLRRVHPEDRNRVSDKVKESTEKNKQSWEDEYRFKCADGNYKHMRDKGYIVYENGLPVKMIGSLQDVTNLKNLEDQLVTEKLQRQKEVSEAVIRAQERERTRIGHELHDNVNQILSTTKLFVDMLTPSNKQEKEIKKKSLDYLLSAIEEIRKLSKELVMPHLKEKSLVESVECLIEDLKVSTNLKISFTHNIDPALISPGIQITLLRIIQEQIKNILKHSAAKKVQIELQNIEGDVKLVIADNGVGFDSHQTTRGIGLSNIFERTRFYNGTSDIKTTPGKGCVLTITIPCLTLK